MLIVVGVTVLEVLIRVVLILVAIRALAERAPPDVEHEVELEVSAFRVRLRRRVGPRHVPPAGGPPPSGPP